MIDQNQSESSSSTPSGRPFLKVCCIILTPVAIIGLVLFWIYGTETHHSNAGSIWWQERNLIPPAATDITLRQDLLDHYVTYTISTDDLHAFLNARFSSAGSIVDAASENASPSPSMVGKPVGPFGWIVTGDMLVYSYWISNGAGSDYYHDPKTGRTYQKSAYW